MFKALSGRFGNVGSLFGFALAYTGSAVIQKAIGFGIFLWLKIGVFCTSKCNTCNIVFKAEE